MNQQIDTQQSADALNLELESERFEQISERVLANAIRHGADQAEVGISKDLGLSVQVRKGDVDTLEFNRDNSFAITVYVDGKKGMVSSSDLSDDGITESLSAAINIAKYTEADPCAGLADKELMANNPTELELDWPTGITAQRAKEIALECEAAGLNADSRISQSEGASFSSHRNLRAYANTHGFFSVTPSTRCSLSCVLIAEDSKGMQRDYWYDIARDMADLESAKHIGKKAAEKTVQRLNGRRISTQKCPVIFTPDMARGLIGSLTSAIKGSSLYRKSSFLIDQLNQQVFPEFFDLLEKPFEKKGLASSWHDSEGVATREQNIVEQGVLKTWLLNSYSARRLGLQTTGHAGGTHNLRLSSTGQHFDELLKMMNRGLIVTDMMGHGVNIVTGDFSRGAAGFWVENGEIQHFVEEITVAGQLQQMFKNIQALGSDTDKRSSIHTGSWLIGEMTVGGES